MTEPVNTRDLFPDRPISPEEFRVFHRRALNLKTYMVVHAEQRTVRTTEERDVTYFVDAVDEQEAIELVRKNEYTSKEETRWEWADDDGEDDGEIISVEVTEWKE